MTITDDSLLVPASFLSCWHHVQVLFSLKIVLDVNNISSPTVALS